MLPAIAQHPTVIPPLVPDYAPASTKQVNNFAQSYRLFSEQHTSQSLVYASSPVKIGIRAVEYGWTRYAHIRKPTTPMADRVVTLPALLASHLD